MPIPLGTHYTRVDSTPQSNLEMVLTSKTNTEQCATQKLDFQAVFNQHKALSNRRLVHFHAYKPPPCQRHPVKTVSGQFTTGTKKRPSNCNRRRLPTARFQTAQSNNWALSLSQCTVRTFPTDTTKHSPFPTGTRNPWAVATWQKTPFDWFKQVQKTLRPWTTR